VRSGRVSAHELLDVVAAEPDALEVVRTDREPREDGTFIVSTAAWAGSLPTFPRRSFGFMALPIALP
jgi:hypothetical protein